MRQELVSILAHSGRAKIQSEPSQNARSSHRLTRGCSARRVFFAGLLSLASTGFAELPVARLFTIFPPGGKAASTVEVEVTGQDLDDLQSLYFSNTNLTAKHLSGAKFSVTIPTNTPIGVYECRAVGRYGVSNPRSFAIGSLPEVRAATTNVSAENASTLALNTTVNAQAVAAGVQFFRFPGKKGQRILIECDAETLDSRMVPSMTIADTSGHELVRKHGDLLDFRPNSDSDFILKVHDFLFRGGNEYSYRLTSSTRPHIDYVFPPSALPGTRAKLTLFGQNLPHSTIAEGLKVDGHLLEQLEVEVDVPDIEKAAPASTASLRPISAFVRGFEYRLETPEGTPNPVFISFATDSVVAEREPNDRSEKAQKLTVPCEAAGRLYPADDRDWFVFSAKKNDVYWIEAFSQRLGIQTDPFVLVQRVKRNAKGEEEASDVQEIYDSESLAGNEFKTGSLDPAWRFNAKEDGEYRLEVRDQFRSVDPRNIYRLAIRKETPDFELAILAQPMAPPKKDSKEGFIVVPALRRGQTIPLKVVALRRDGFKEGIDLGVEDLPSSISASRARIPEGTNSTLLFLTATDDKGFWSGPCKVVGHSQSNAIVREARAATAVWNSSDTTVEPLQIQMAREFSIALIEETAPIRIVPAKEEVLESCVKAKLEVPLRVQRATNFVSALKLKAIGVPGLEGLKEFEVEAKGTNATVQLDLQKARPGDYELVFQTQATGKYLKGDKPRDETLIVYSKPIHLKIAPAPETPNEERSSTNDKKRTKSE